MHEAIRITFDEMTELGLAVPEEPAVTIENIVANATLGRRLNLTAISLGLGIEHVEYEPEQFPGLVYRLDEPAVVTLLFASGQLVITGGTCRADAEKAIRTIHATLSDLGLVER